MKKLFFCLCFILTITISFDAVSKPYQKRSISETKIVVTVKGLQSATIQLDTISAIPDKKGTIAFQLPVETARYVTLKVQDKEIPLFAEPGKDISISFTEGKMDETIRFKGKNAAINEFLYEQLAVSQRFNRYFNSHINTYLSKLPEKQFVTIMDSLQASFMNPLERLKKKHPKVSQAFLREYRVDTELTFLSFLAAYPLLHLKNTGKTVALSESSKEKLNSINLNDLLLHKYSGGQSLLKNFLYREINEELTRIDYTTSDNQRLNAGFAVIIRAFSNQEVRDKVLSDFLQDHMENLGVKNIENNIASFNELCQNTALKEKVNTSYIEARKEREGHLVRTYKKVDGHNLDAHIFLPDTLLKGVKCPVVAMFHGGSFSEGKPDWLFSSCKSYAKRGWLAVAVEYRVADRHGNLLPDAIADGQTLVRYVRANAAEFQIDTSKVMVTGNSAGAAIALALATLDSKLDEPTETSSYSSRPNAVMANASPADLTESGHYWWHRYYDAEFIKSISPLHQVKEGLPPILLIHGNEDTSVDINPVRQFAARANELGNQVEFYELEGAPHMIWLIPYFSRQIENHRQKFLEKLRWE